MTLPDVISRNGSSSAGKISIARALQARLPEPYLHFGMNHVFPWLPPHTRGLVLVVLAFAVRNGTALGLAIAACNALPPTAGAIWSRHLARQA